MLQTNISKDNLNKIHQKFTKKQNIRRWYVHGQLNAYFKKKELYVKINRDSGIIEIPCSIEEQLSNNKLPKTISKYFHELLELGYVIQLSIN